MSEHYFENIEWLQKRAGHFTSSQIYKLFIKSRTKGELFGETAKTYILEKVAEIMTGQVKEERDFIQAEWGKSQELDCISAFEDAINVDGNYYGVGDPQFFKFGDMLGGSPDWEKKDLEDGADFKCPYNSAEHVRNLFINSGAELKDRRWEYYCQLQMNMIGRGWKRAHFVSFDPRMIEPKLRLKIITIFPDSEWIAEYKHRTAAAIEIVNSFIDETMKTWVIDAPKKIVEIPENTGNVDEPGENLEI